MGTKANFPHPTPSNAIQSFPQIPHSPHLTLQHASTVGPLPRHVEGRKSYPYPETQQTQH